MVRVTPLETQVRVGKMSMRKLRRKNGVISAATLFHIDKQALLRQKDGGISAAASFHVSTHSVL